MPENGLDVADPGDGGNRRMPQGSPKVPPNARGEDALVKTRTERRRERRDELALLERARKRFKKCDEAEAANRREALEDLKFKAGDQWSADDKAKRNQKRRPCLTINKIPTLTHQVSNDLRQNRPGINVSPVGDQATKEAAEMYAAVIRAIERDSAAEIAYDTGVGSAVDIGFGYWRVLTEYESESTFDQVLVVRRVRNPFTVLLDYKRQEPDGSDARFGFVSELIDREEFKDQWPDADPVSFKGSNMGEDMQAWASRDQVRVAEYFEITHERRRLIQLDSGHTGYYDELSEATLADIASGKRQILDDRHADVPTVMWYKITGREILESHEWPGKWIPIIEVVGEEIDLEGKVVRSGLIRHAKDPARAKNFWVTTKTELYALQPKNPWKGPEGSFEGYESDWDQANIENVTRLEYVQQYSPGGAPLPAPTREPPPQIAAGYVEAEKSSEQDLMGVTGIRFDATLSERTFDESGKAIRELRRAGDIGSFHYADNFARSLRHFGRVLVDLIPKVYVRKRTVPALGEDGREFRMVIDPQSARAHGTVRQAGGEPLKVLNPTIGQYGVAITVGPSYATKRIEAQESLSRLVGQMPDPMRGIVAALMVKYADWPGSTELYKALAKTLPPGILAPDVSGLPPEVQALIQGLNQRIAKLMAERMQMLKDLTDKQGDRAVLIEKVHKDFEAKLLKIFADMKKAADRSDADTMRLLLQSADVIDQRTGPMTGEGDLMGAGGMPAVPLAS